MRKKKSTANSLKLQIVKAYLHEKKPISELAKEHDIKPSQIYLWVSQLFENGERCFERKNDRKTGEGAAQRYESAMNEMEAKLNQKNAVISDLMVELLSAKKSIGTFNLTSGSLLKSGTKL